MELEERREEAVELEALLTAREYLYELFYKLFGGTPDAELIEILCSDVTEDVVEEFAGDNPSLKGLVKFIRSLRDEDREALVGAARDEFTRLFIGPGELVCQPIEGPYLTHEATTFQENTVNVRRIYRDHGLELRKIQRIPEDHIAAMCGYMAIQAGKANDALLGADLPTLIDLLRDQEGFVSGHLTTWADDFARCARRSKTAVLYPQMIEAFAAFVANDRTVLSEGAFWAELTVREELPEDVVAPVVEALEPVRQDLRKLEAIEPYGIADFEFKEI